MSFGETSFAAICTRAKEVGRKLIRSEIIAVLDAEYAKASKGRKRAAIASEAEQVYELYPLKVAKEAALIAITKALTKHELPYLLDKTNQFAEAVRSWPTSYRYFQDGGNRCPYPATWFNEGRYADDPTTWRRRGAHSPAPSQHVSPPEPEGWQAKFPDYVNKDRPWNTLPSLDQDFIIKTLSAMDVLTSPVKEVEQEMARREA